MFANSFLIQLLFFVLAHVAAIRNMRTGRVAAGFFQFAAVWILADAALVLRFVFEERGIPFLAVLAAMQILSVWSFLRHVHGRAQRRREVVKESRDRRYADALDLYMGGHDQEALGHWRSLARKEPWAAASAFMVGTLSMRLASRRRAISWMKRARLLAWEDSVLRNTITEELRRFREEGLRQKELRKHAGRQRRRAAREEPASDRSGSGPDARRSPRQRRKGSSGGSEAAEGDAPQQKLLDRVPGPAQVWKAKRKLHEERRSKRR